MKQITLLAFTAVLLTSGAQAKTLVVDPARAGASDANPGSDAQPLQTIGRAAELVQPGDVVRIHAGVYREKVIIQTSGTKEQPICFEAAPGAAVVITGADLLTGWTKESDTACSIPWRYKLFQGDDHNPGGAEQVIIGGALLRKAPNLQEMTEGCFYVDLSGKRLYLHAPRNPDDDRATRPVEGSTRSEVWVVNGSFVHTRGLRFRYAANRAQQGMVQFRGDNNLIEGCVFEWSNSTGVHFEAEDITVRRCTFQDNGQQGFSANRSHRMRFDGCTVQRNNVKEYPRGWEAGSFKICFSRGVILENSRFLKNHGTGVWFDISNIDSTVRNCLIADNEDAGIFYEISYSLHAHDNVIVGNGLAQTKGAWGANGGVCVSSSPGCLIERNLIVGNQQGFCFREQNRTTRPIAELDRRPDGKARAAEVPVWNHDEVVRDNLIVSSRTAQVQGWFDIASERHWPKAMQTSSTQSGKAKEDRAAGYQARKDLAPPGLSLEDLKLAFRGNIYAFEPSQPFFIWGTNWKRKQEFKDLATVHQALGFEDDNSRILPAIAMDVEKRDFRLPADLFKAVDRTYPRGAVPDCLLGVCE